MAAYARSLNPDCRLDDLVNYLTHDLKRDDMFNNPLIHEETKLKIAEREQEAESHRLYQQLGYSNRNTARWVFALVALVIAMLLVMIVL
jgi:hypothetical protein